MEYTGRKTEFFGKGGAGGWILGHRFCYCRGKGRGKVMVMLFLPLLLFYAALCFFAHF